MPDEISTIRRALQHSLFVGVRSDLDWFTCLQQDALSALKALESGYEGNSVGDPVSVSTTTPPAVQTVSVACAWPPTEGCTS